MIARIASSRLMGRVAAVPSKSQAHRLLVLSALADRPTNVYIGRTGDDIEATIGCLRALGAQIDRRGESLYVHPIHPAARCVADCGESGSTLRFLLPVAGALGINAEFYMRGRLPTRPLAPLEREMTRGGCAMHRPRADAVSLSGQLRAGEYTLPGNVSSQYVSGLLMALQALDAPSEIYIEGGMESAAYVDMTIDAMRMFGASVERKTNAFLILGGGYTTSGDARTEGDWSNAAHWLCANALGCGIEVSGLDAASAQGDRRVTDEIARICAERMHTLDASDIPDIAPVLSALAAANGHGLRVIRAQRLRLKESDRIASTVRMINALGGRAYETEDGWIVEPGIALRCGTADAAGDHRIAMAAAVAALECRDAVTICGAEAVRKSYPDFWNDFARLGGRVQIMGEADA